VTVHDLAWLADPSHVTPRGLKFFRRGFELVKKDADLVLCPSQATIDAVSKAGVESARLRLVPLGVRAAAAAEGDIERVRTRYELGSPYVMWTGTIEPRKNLGRLVEAFRGLDEGLDLVLVGPKGWNEDLARLTAGIENRVKVLGFVPEEDLGPLYAGAEVFCYPSLLEGFGFPVLEAMAQGTPVVTSSGTSTEELAGDAAIVVDPRDPAAIAEGLRSVLEDPVRADKLGAAGRTRASEFSWERTARLLQDAYAEVAA
jgi:glycosyltransferase involved in cell wall biosynthesis